MNHRFSLSIMRAILHMVFVLLLAFVILPGCCFAKEQLAVMPLKAEYGVEERLASALSAIIWDEVNNFAEFKVLRMADLKNLIHQETVMQGRGCDDTLCLVNFGEKIGVKFIVVGAMSKLGSTYSINLRLIDTKGENPGVTKRVNRQCKCTENDLFGAAKAVVSKLMGKNATTSTRKTGTSASQEQQFTNQIGQSFVYIKPGIFMMGSPLSEKKRDKDEVQHEVTLNAGFYMQTAEVTQGQWQKIMGNNPSFFESCGENCPVENVSWNQIQEFLRKLNQQSSGKIYKLPTEAQWEYACRAGSTTIFNTGVCLSTSQANFDGTFLYPGCEKGQYRKRTIPVAQLAPNAWGLYDMHGNVYEWCQDWYAEYPNYSVTDPGGSLIGTNRVLRGGGWNYDVKNCRSADRAWDALDGRAKDRGFRLVSP